MNSGQFLKYLPGPISLWQSQDPASSDIQLSTLWICSARSRSKYVNLALAWHAWCQALLKCQTWVVMPVREMEQDSSWPRGQTTALKKKSDSLSAPRCTWHEITIVLPLDPSLPLSNSLTLLQQSRLCNFHLFFLTRSLYTSDRTHLNGEIASFCKQKYADKIPKAYENFHGFERKVQSKNQSKYVLLQNKVIS